MSTLSSSRTSARSDATNRSTASWMDAPVNPLPNPPRALPGRVPLVAVAAVLAWLSACAPSGAASAAQGAPPLPSVGVQTVASVPLVERVELTGRIGAVEAVAVRPRISGYVQEVLFQSGELVERDQVLFRIDPRWNDAEVERRAAELAGAEARLAVAEREQARAARLVDSRAISAEESESRTARVLEARSALAAAKAEHATALLDLEYTEVRAPIAGRVSRALVTAGNFVSGASGTNTELTTIVSVDPMYLYADLDEGAFLRFEQLAREHERSGKSLPLEVGLADETGFPRRGVLESLDNQLDIKSGTILLRARLPNTDGRLVPGLFARARIPLSDERLELVVDERAIGTDQNLKFVLVVGDGDLIEYRQVKLGPVIEGRRVIRTGLAAGERVVVTGLQKVRPGVQVKPEAPPTPDAAASSTANAGR